MSMKLMEQLVEIRLRWDEALARVRPQNRFHIEALAIERGRTTLVSASQWLEHLADEDVMEALGSA